MPLKEDERGPVIRGRCKLDSDEARRLLVTPDEAARRIRDDGVRGFYVYANKSDHGTKDLIFTDEDEPEKWPETPDTLRVVSGSGTGQHGYWRNAGWNRGADWKGDGNIGGVRVVNTGLVVPGSIHRDCDGIYHVVEGNSPVSLSPSDVPKELRPLSDSSPGEHTYQGLDEPDENAVETVQEAIFEFRCNSDSTRRAVKYFENLRAGRDLREHGFIPDDSKNTNGCRHEANLSLASKLYGMLLMNGEHDKERNGWLIHQYLSQIAQQYPRTSCGQQRKLQLSDDYIANVVQTAIKTFDHEPFSKWMRQTEEFNFTGEYSGITQETVIIATEVLAEEEGPYPTKAEIVELCQGLDDNPHAKGTYEKCLFRLAGKRLHQANCGGNDYRYYPLGMDDPEDAVEIK
ncbi:hypothetical protein [Halalkalicoccus salilacus]|uniref:hypothetical protein n=1 Tax=Halalkalicoccus salilacus TaxID=3117459 RepID=UPI00300F21DA